MTFPFILGSLRSPAGSIVSVDTSRQELRGLLQSMLDDIPANYILRISRCDHLKQPVVAPWSVRYKLDGLPAYSCVQTRNTLFINSEFFPNGVVSLDSLTNRLWQEFGDAVTDGRFSIRPDSTDYCAYSQEDIDIIEQSCDYEFDEDAS